MLFILCQYHSEDYIICINDVKSTLYWYLYYINQHGLYISMILNSFFFKYTLLRWCAFFSYLNPMILILTVALTANYPARYLFCDEGYMAPIGAIIDHRVSSKVRYVVSPNKDIYGPSLEPSINTTVLRPTCRGERKDGLPSALIGTDIRPSFSRDCLTLETHRAHLLQTVTCIFAKTLWLWLSSILISDWSLNLFLSMYEYSGIINNKHLLYEYSGILNNNIFIFLYE